ncbi:MAG: CDP-glycerol glycerophosphotransferase family protein [Candidatus Cloacimonadota bacterium]|nr:CDP-glycerol glycerophosphotransferase family protein [Candidatus Cloacimonadota bacterium]
MKIKYFIRLIVMESFSLLLGILALIIPKHRGLILFGSFSAERFGDNSAALFCYIHKNHPELTAVWMTNNDHVVEEIKQIGGSVLKRRTLSGIWLSLRAEVVVSSHGIKDAIMFEPFFHRPKLVYLGHGIPLKKGWIGIENIPVKFKKASLRKIKYSTFMISSSEFSAQLQNDFLPIGKNKVKIIGLPRNDMLFELDKHAIQKKYNLDEFKNVIFYAPTFRNWELTRFFPFEDYNIKELNKFCELNEACFILRPHHNDLKSMNTDFWKEIKGSSNFRIITHERCSNVNELLVASDCLITDYSSIFFDYLLLNRPMIFLPYDLEKYKKEHGFLIDYDSVTSGYKPKDQKKLLKNLEQIIYGKDEFKSLRNKLKNKVHEYQDSNACFRVTKEIKGLMK